MGRIPTTMDRTRRSVTLGVAVLALVAAACGGSTAGSDDTPATAVAESPSTPAARTATAVATGSGSAAPATLRVLATTSNLFESNRAIRLEVDHDGGPLVRTTSIRLASDLWEPLDAVPRDLDLAAGTHVLVPLPYGPANCATPSDSDLGDVVFATSDGPLQVPLEDYPDGLLSGRHARECAVRAASDAVAITFGTDFEQESARVANGTLVVAPKDGHQVELSALAGNIIFGLTTSRRLPLVVPSDGLALDVRMAANRCDTHALIEAKRKLTHHVEVAVDGADPVVVEVTADGPTGDLFGQLLAGCMGQPESAQG